MSGLNDLPFEGPFDFIARAWRPVIRSGPIVYRLRAYDALTGQFRPIPRAGGIDQEGILDIGESNNGRRRLEDFCRAVEGHPRSRRADQDYSRDGYDFGAVFAPETLRIDFILLRSKRLAEAIELALLEDYRWRLKDRPPLTGSAGKHHKVELWLRQSGREPRNADGWLDLEGLLPTKDGYHRW